MTKCKTKGCENEATAYFNKKRVCQRCFNKLKDKTPNYVRKLTWLDKLARIQNTT